MSKGQGARDRGQGKTGFSSPLAPRPSPPTSTKRVLIIGPSNIGDGILAGGVMASVHARCPDAHVTLAVGARAKALFVEDPRIQVLVDTDLYDSARGRLTLAWILWRYQPHAVIDLRHTLYPLLLKPLSAWRYLRQPPKALIHMRERHLWKLRAQAPALAPSNGPLSANATPLWFTPKDHAHADTLWRRWGFDQRHCLVIIAPGARSHIKRWTAEGFARVADRLIAELRARVLLSGEPDEESVIQEVIGLMHERAHSAVGLTTIRQLGVLMQRAALVITNDSASLHLASAVQTPTVALFGPTDDAKYGPTAPQAQVIRRRLFCAPCEQALCRFNHECMRFIGAEEVYQAARQLLEQSR
ncbi:MAG: glycosyltransferase family 9 protein [Candidatus Omnitrophica bacterium]|nr:glycosyltransferase family 9 protein [Candidatus Omnitrophota bacterium]